LVLLFFIQNQTTPNWKYSALVVADFFVGWIWRLFSLGGFLPCLGWLDYSAWVGLVSFLMRLGWVWSTLFFFLVNSFNVFVCLQFGTFSFNSWVEVLHLQPLSMLGISGLRPYAAHQLYSSVHRAWALASRISRKQRFSYASWALWMDVRAIY